MPTRRFHAPIAALAALTAALTGCTTQPRPVLDESPDASVSVEFGPEAGAPVRLGARNTLTVEVNGETVPRVLFDTGAGGFVIRPSHASRLGLPRTGTVTVSSVGAQRKMPTVWVEALSVGGMTVRHTEAVELDTDFVGLIGLSRAGGLIGATIMDHAVVELDLEASTIALHDPASYALPTDASWVRTTRVPMGLAVGGEFERGSGLMLIDSGAEMSVQVAGDAVERLGLAEHYEGDLGRIGVMDRVYRTLRTELEFIEVAGQRVEAVDADLVLEAEHELPGCIALLGRDFLKRFTIVIDAPGERMAFILK